MAIRLIILYQKKCISLAHMCTLTFIHNSSGISISSNRDEHVDRGISKFPVTLQVKDQLVTFPQDPEAGGTWLAASSSKRVTVLLNGAFRKHKHLPPYRLSRGVVVLESFQYENLAQFRLHYNLTDIEPFTLVHFDLLHQHIEEVRWDGESTSYRTLAFNAPHIWSSATLYNDETIRERENWFKEWIQKPNLDAQQMMNFHQFGGGTLHANSITMKRNSFLKTVSISQVTACKNHFNFSHHILLNDTLFTTKL